MDKEAKQISLVGEGALPWCNPSGEDVVVQPIGRLQGEDIVLDHW